MQEGYNSNITPPANNGNVNNNATPSNGTTIIQTDVASKDGQNKCPRCGSTDIETNTNNGN